MPYVDIPRYFSLKNTRFLFDVFMTAVRATGSFAAVEYATRGKETETAFATAAITALATFGISYAMRNRESIKTTQFLALIVGGIITGLGIVQGQQVDIPLSDEQKRKLKELKDREDKLWKGMTGKLGAASPENGGRKAGRIYAPDGKSSLDLNTGIIYPAPSLRA